MNEITSSSIKKLNKFLNNWLYKNGFRNITTAFDRDFSYDLVNDILYYSIIVTDKHDKLFLDVCKKYYPNEIIKMDTFILSFFHELGHYMTQDNFSDQEWETYLEYTDKLNQLDKVSDEDYIKYYNLPIELEATKWGCNYIYNNENKVKKFFKKFKKQLLKVFKDFQLDEEIYNG